MIDISEPYKTVLADEIKLICEKIEEEKDPRKKMYYYSAAYSAVQRVFNLDSKFEPQLVFIHLVLLFSYKQISERITSLIMGDRLVTLPEDFFDRLTACLKQIELNIRNSEDSYTALQEINVLTYMTGGNGHYLYQIGKLKLP